VWVSYCCIWWKGVKLCRNFIKRHDCNGVLILSENKVFFLVFFIEVRGAASNSAYYGYHELWILRYPAHRYHAVPSLRFEPTTLWLRVRHPSHSATTLQAKFVGVAWWVKVLDLWSELSGFDTSGSSWHLTLTSHFTLIGYMWRVWFQNAINPFLCIQEKCSQSLKFTGKCGRNFFRFWLIKSRRFEQLGYNLADLLYFISATSWSS
jgi:hypothetical protein